MVWFVWCGIDCSCWAAIFEVDDRICDFHPEPFVELRFCDNSLDSLHNRSICPFCDAVLVWAVGCGCLMNNPGAFEMGSHPFFVFSTAVCSQALDNLSRLFLHLRLVLPELLQHAR